MARSPSRLAALPLAIADGSLTVAATFVGKVGASQGKRSHGVKFDHGPLNRFSFHLGKICCA